MRMTQTACRTDVEHFCSRLPQFMPADSVAAHTVVVTRAPAVVDVMGGSCEESGGLALQGALDVAVAAAASPRNDQRIVICWMTAREQPREYGVPVSALTHATPPELLGREDVTGFEAIGTKLILHLLRLLVTNGSSQPLAGGLSIIVRCDWPTDAQLDLAGALGAAVIEAVAAAIAAPYDVLHKSGVCRSASIAAGIPSHGHRVPLASLLAVPGSLLLVRTQPHPSQDVLELPEGTTIVALDSEIGRPVAASRQYESRVAALMGHTVIRDLIRSDHRNKAEVNASYLANVPPEEFVARFRNRVPTKMTGKAFIERHGSLSDPQLVVDPARTYKIRSRAEHVIYESRRVDDFTAEIARARRTGDPKHLEQAGELMYASHWSYSQRCGVGTLETDLIITAIRERGAANGFFGAKSTGYGAGGGVVVLMRDTSECHDALAQALADVQGKTGRRIRVFRGAASGAAKHGARRLEPAAVSA